MIQHKTSSPITSSALTLPSKLLVNNLKTNCFAFLSTIVQSIHFVFLDVPISKIIQTVSTDKELMEYMTQYNFINILKGIIDGEFGYHLVAIASEIYCIKAISNISDEYIVQSIHFVFLDVPISNPLRNAIQFDS